ncbi:O-antigen ligase family protein [Pontibacter akesuensis]|uniref:O-antigen ligase-related domain-containing protein n=1 Tax=Pontibacter akesuensis TaxID=388950 RepID=A0A1I7GH19_9BACT|nr:O-antigen ligase family protein [Pontibacter akesuensis]GHA56857.1 membrane protein [Pontibacter akesuensis]SFU47777.1 hypothetical protein SAMN04487941_1009 [Pontibacter akesuensis]
MRQFAFIAERKTVGILLPVATLIAVGIGWLTANIGILVPGMLVLLAVAIPFVLAVFYNPRLGLKATIIYCFFLFGIAREVGGFPYGLLVDGLLVFTWIAVFFSNSKALDWDNIKNDLCLITLLWFLITVLELANPADASPMGWLQEMRGTALYWLLAVPLSLMLFNTNKDLNSFLTIIIVLSVVAALVGIKQLHIGLSTGEQAFLDAGANKTHILFGKLRVFSLYSDAGQFGASQAHLCLVALVLALGPFKIWIRVLLLAAAGILFYGMLISGTRGALFALVVGVAVALFLSKNFKILLLGSFLALSGLFILKYTYIGNSSYHIYRLRTALNPEDASLGVRLYNQERLAEYLDTRPFGGGVGVIGYWGERYNSDKYLSTIPPDSYWVKVWASYGIVGFIIWFGMMMYILGKCCGIVWRIQDKALRIKLMALTAGAAGILFCSYGNEVINAMPSAIIVYVSWAFVFLGPKMDKKILNDSVAQANA